MKVNRMITYGIMIIGISLLTTGLGVYSNTVGNKIDLKSIATNASQTIQQEEIEEEKPSPTKEIEFPKTQMIITQAGILKTAMERYDEMSIEELEQALYSGNLQLEYSALYTSFPNRLSKSKGALYFNGHKETYYSEKVLPGTSLNIPGRHVAEDGTIRDQDGYICVASDPNYLAKGSILITSVGPAKVYDTGCAYGTIDIYVNW